jgi:hypothetical protein
MQFKTIKMNNFSFFIYIKRYYYNLKDIILFFIERDFNLIPVFIFFNPMDTDDNNNHSDEGDSPKRFDGSDSSDSNNKSDDDTNTPKKSVDKGKYRAIDDN